MASEGIHLVNDEGVTVVYNKAASEFDGLLPEEVLGKHVLDVFPSLTHDSSTLLRVLRSGIPEIARQQTFSNYKGKKITTINSTHPIIVHGKVIGACEVSTDITRIKEMAERIADLGEELRSQEPAGKAGQVRAGERRLEFSPKLYTVDDIAGQSALMRDVRRRVMQVARTQSNVIVWGETGTGKELVVQSIHSASDRAGFAFVAQNCAALPEGLLEGLVFGTSKGGFTGARDRPGLLELASGGTLYLDEIDSMPLALQAKLLRVIQEQRVRRLGDVRERPVDVRIIGSTSIPPRQAVEQELLRPDLYFRLAVVEIGVPPLRKRQEDIPLLCSHFLYKHSSRAEAINISPEVMSAFLTYAWPGNVRELEHAVEGSLAFAKGNTIELEHIPSTVRGITAAAALFRTIAQESHEKAPGAPQPLPASHSAGKNGQIPHPSHFEVNAKPSGPESGRTDSPTQTGNLSTPGRGPVSHKDSIRSELRSHEKAAIEEALKQGGSVSQAARILGIPRQTLQYRMKILGIAAPGRSKVSK